MGISGTVVTQNAADVVLADDNFATIVSAIREGRRIYMNAQKYTTVNMSMKGGECISLLLSIAAGLPVPIMPLQQIANLITTHVICTLPFAWEEPEPYAMKVPPRNTKTDFVVPWSMWKFRWLPFVISQPIVVLFVLILSVWGHTGHVFSHYMMGSSTPGELDEGHTVCEYAGTINQNKIYKRDFEPFHCRCLMFRDGLPVGERIQLDQWGRVLTKNEFDRDFDRLNGQTGPLFLQENTPWSTGVRVLLKECTDGRGTIHYCWKGSEFQPRPVLPKLENCGAYGSHLGQTMAYATLQMGEILTILSYRRDDFFLYTMFSNPYYNGALVFNVMMLIIFLYVPPVSNGMVLLPLSPSRLFVSLFFAVVLLAATEAFKLFYRNQKYIENAALEEEALMLSVGQVRKKPNRLQKPHARHISLLHKLQVLDRPLIDEAPGGPSLELLTRCHQLENELDSVQSEMLARDEGWQIRQGELEARLLRLEAGRE